MPERFALGAWTREVIVRPALEQDIEGIARVSVDTWRLTYRNILPTGYLSRMRLAAHEAQRRRMMRSDDTAHFAAEEPATGETVGFVSAGPARGGGPLVSGEVYELYVQNGFQRCGLGRRLLQQAAAWLGARGHEAMVVWVLADNANRAFYERLGGRPAGEREIRVGRAPVQEAAYVWFDLAQPLG